MLKFFWQKFITKFKFVFIIALFLYIFSQMGMIFFGYCLKPLINSAVYGGSESLLKWGIIFIGVSIASFILGILAQIILSFSKLKLQKYISLNLSTHTLNLSPNFIFDKQSGYILQRILNDVKIALNIISPMIFSSLARIFSSIFLFWIMFKVNSTLTLIALCCYPILIVDMWFLVPKLRPLAYKVQELFAKLSGKIQENIEGITTINIFNIKDNVNKSVEQNFTIYVKHSWGYYIKSLFLNTIIPTVCYWPFYAFLLWLATKQVSSNIITIGSAIAFFYLLLEFPAPISAGFQIAENLQPSLAAMQRIKEFLEEFPTLKIEKGVKFPRNCDIIIKDLSFSYDGKKPVLKKISLNIPQNKITFISGKSGVGKTTLARILLKIYDNYEGEILINGIPLQKIDFDDYRKNVGFMEQDTFIFNTSVYENILIGKLNADKKEIIDSTLKARCEFINFLPQKFDTIIGEKGFSLSGGERQRIGLARLFLKNPTILILDEPTSALDTKVEQELKNELIEICKNRTVILISHRNFMDIADIAYELTTDGIRKLK